MKKITIGVALTLLVANSALADAADTAKEHSALVKSAMLQNALARCRSAQFQKLAGPILKQHNGCPEDLDINALLNKAVEGCPSEYDAAYAAMKNAYSYSKPTPEEAQATAVAQMDKVQAKWSAKAATALTKVCGK